ncbi:MAG TPA: hypothetical protein VMG99_05635 [Thermoplasmata archaeon]|nr:hypothetical protein [Thermoplasmata archaeon]
MATGTPARPDGAQPPPSVGPPAVRTVEEAVRRGDARGAVLEVFPTVMREVEAAFGSPFPRSHTARQVLAQDLRTDAGGLVPLLFRLYEIYEPVRFGPPEAVPPGDVVATVRRIYESTVLARRGAPAVPTYSVRVPAPLPATRPLPEATGGNRW